MTKKYDFKYQIILDDNNENGFDEGEIEKNNDNNELVGVMDGAFFIPVRKDKKGLFYTLDVQCCSKNLSSMEEFHTWCLMAKSMLDDTPDLPDYVQDIYKSIVKKSRELQVKNNEIKGFRK